MTTYQAAGNIVESTRDAWDRIAEGYDRTNTPTQMWLGNEGLRRAGAALRHAVPGRGGRQRCPEHPRGAPRRAGAGDRPVSGHARAPRRARAQGGARHRDPGHGRPRARAGRTTASTSPDRSSASCCFPTCREGIREMARVVKPGGRVLMNVYGDPHKIEFFGFFVGAIQAVVPSFEGPPMDPLPLPFQLQDPERLRQELANAGLRRTSAWRRSPRRPRSSPGSTCGTGWCTATRSSRRSSASLNLTSGPARRGPAGRWTAWSASAPAGSGPASADQPDQHRRRDEVSRGQVMP